MRSASGTDRVGALWRWTEADGEVRLVDPADLLAGADEELTHEERARRERAREAAGGIVGYTVDAAFTRVAFALSGRLFVTEVDGSSTRELPVDGAVIDPRIDPTGQRVAFVTARRLHVVSIDSRRIAGRLPRRVVRDGDVGTGRLHRRRGAGPLARILVVP